MPALALMSVHEQLRSDIAGFIGQLTTWDEYDPFLFRRLIELCKKQQSQNSGLGSLNMVILYAAIGDADKADFHLRNAESHGYVDEARLDRSTYYANHGRASEACELLSGVLLRPCNLNLMQLGALAVSVGAINQFVSFVNQTTENGMVLKMTSLLPKMKRAVEVMQRLKVTDVDLSKMLDAGGEVLRDRRLHFQGSMIDLHVIDEEFCSPALGLAYRVALPPDEAASMSWALAEVLLDRGLDKQNVSLSFIGTVLPVKLAA